MSTSSSYGETNRVLRTGDTMSGPLTIGRLVGTDLAFQAVTAGDVAGRVQFLANGQVQWGDGTNPPDVVMYRSAANVLRTEDQFSIYRVGQAANAELRLSTDAGFMGNIRFRTGTLDRWGFQTDGSAEGGANAGSNLQVARYDDAGALIGTVMTFNRATGVAAIQVAGLANGAIVSVDGAQALTNKTYSGFGATPTTVNMSQRVTGDTQLRWVIDASGTMQWSPGSGAFDSNFGRIAAGIIGTTVEFRSARSSALNIGLSTLVTGDTVPRWQVTGGGVVGYGPGNAAIDGTWSRIQAGGVAWSAVGVTALMDIRTGAVSTNSTLRFSVGSVPRWEIGKNATVEPGGGTQVGSDFEIRAISDNGLATNATITITRANGNIALPGLTTTTRATGATAAISTQATGDSVARHTVLADGTHQWGSGSGAVDTFLARQSAGVLRATNTAIQVTQGTGTFGAFQTLVLGADTTARISILANGQIDWSSGAAAMDISFARQAANILAVFPAAANQSAAFVVAANAAGQTSSVLLSTTNTAAGARWQIAKNNTAEGGANAGSNLEIRALTDAGAALSTPVSIVRSTGAVTLANDLRINGNVGFYNTAPVAKPTVTGSRGGNAALASLLTALAGQGLLTDSSTA